MTCYFRDTINKIAKLKYYAADVIGKYVMP